MVTLEQVEQLRQRANISYDEAKAALEETNGGDLLQAIINLEKQNCIKPPKGGGFFQLKKYSTKLSGQRDGRKSK